MLQGLAAAGAMAALSPAPLSATSGEMFAFQGEAGAAVKKVVESLGGMKRFVSKGDKVVIKPNLGFAVPPLRGATTDPAVIRTLAELALEAGAKSVQVLDNPVHPIIACEARNGMATALEKVPGLVLKLLKDEKYFADVTIPRGRQLKRAQVMRAILECDALINVPVAKSHSGALVSFSLKNWMGAVKNRHEWHNDFDLHQAIADFATFIKPKFIVLDATRALVTGGPGGPGEVKPLQIIAGGLDPVAIDAFAVQLSPWNGKTLKPHDVPHIRLAEEMGIGKVATAAIPILPVFA
jgi:uncharacterized protein (DUF362 family)